MRSDLVILAATLLSGCASTASIDLSKVETNCGQTCAKNYSQCVSAPTNFPIQVQHECVDALRLCAQACPPRK